MPIHSPFRTTLRRALLPVLLAAPVALTACEGLRDAFSAQPDVVARASTQRLSTDRLVGLMTAVPRSGLTREAAEYMANLWVDLTLFTEAWVDGDLEADSATVARVQWPQISQAVINEWHDTLVSRRPQMTEAAADSVFQAGEVRLFQHILRVPAGVRPADSAAARDEIGRVLSQVRRGGDFGVLAGQNADATREDSGFLGVGPRGQFVPAFDDVAWTLEPGGVSDVVTTEFGYHLIRRTPQEEALPRFTTWLQQREAGKADSAYIADLASASNLQVAEGAAARVREALEDRSRAARNRRQLATWNGGAFTVSDLARWLEMLPPNAPAQISSQPDSVIEGFVESLAQNTLVLRQADSARIVVDAADWQAMQLGFRAMVSQLAAAMQLTDSVVTDSTRPRQVRLDSARSRVSQFLDRLVAGQAMFSQVPPSLSAYLRESASRAEVNQAGIARAMELYTARSAADSAARASEAPAGPITPAPGPAPVPQGDSGSP